MVKDACRRGEEYVRGCLSEWSSHLRLGERIRTSARLQNTATEF